MAIVHRARKPLHDFYKWLMKLDDPVLIDGETRNPSKIAKLVWYQGGRVLDELDKLTWSTAWALELGHCHPQLRRVLAASIHLLTMQHHADFDRRIMRSL
eukprot:4715292-Pyramimonas_sp.AAC.1